MYEIFEQLLQANGVTPYQVSKETGISQSTLSDWKRGRSTPKNDKLQKIADYFGVPLTYLISGANPDTKKEAILTKEDEKDIKKDLDNIMHKLKEGKDGPVHYNGEEIDAESIELFENAMELALKTLKVMNKEKYNPNKNKSR